MAKAVGKRGCPNEFQSPGRSGIRQPERRDTDPFGTDVAPDGAENLLTVDISHGSRRGPDDGATAVA
jgi:hypothetical protein